MKILFLVGPHAVGKTYTSREYVSKRGNIKMVDTGPIMRTLHSETAPNTTMAEWVSNLERQYGQNATSHLISTEIENIMMTSECDKYILVGFRTIEGISYTVEHLNIKDYDILYVDAEDELLYKNYLARRQKDISFEDFKKYLDNELASGLGNLKRLALESETIDYYHKSSNDDLLEDIFDCYFNNCKVKQLRKENSDE